MMIILLQRKCFTIGLKVFICIVITFHIIGVTVGFVTSGANVLILKGAHLSFKT